MNIALLDDYQNAVRGLPAIARLAGHRVDVYTDACRDPQELAHRLADVEVLMLIRERTPITAAMLERLPALKLISQYGNVPNIDLAACARHGVLVSAQKVPGRPSYATAELTWGLIIAAARRIPQEMRALQEGRWQASPTLGRALRGQTLGILGYGRIGKVVAGYGAAFGMRVVVGGRAGSLERAAADHVEVVPSLEALFEQSDVLSIHVPLNASSRGVVTPALLARMKPTAMFVNTSRAGLVAPGALEEALRAGRPGSAGIDVFENEPVLGGTHPLLAMDNVVVTPHLGYAEQGSLSSMFDIIVEQILAYAAGTPTHLVEAPKP